MRYWLALSTLVALTGPALAETPTEAVRFFYLPPKYEPDPDLRARFTDPAKTLFEQNDRAVEKNEGLGCIDFSPGIDGQDYDENEIKRTLKLKEAEEGDTATVTAKFTLFPNSDDEARREMVWTLKKEGGKWLVADLESVTTKWTLSAFTCEEPKG